MVHFIKIRNFGPIHKEAELNFEVLEKDEAEAYEVPMPDGKRLLKLAYIYGANASGKTTFLKAFEFLRGLLLQPLSDKSQHLLFEPFLFNKAPYKKPSSFELSFYCGGVRYVYQLEFNKQSVLKEKLVFYGTTKPTELFFRTTDWQKRLTKIQFGSKIKVLARERDLLESNTLHNNTVIGAYAKTNVDIPELEALYSFFSDFLFGMITPAVNLLELTAGMMNTNQDFKKWMNEFLYKADGQISGVQAHEDFISIPLDLSELTVASRFLRHRNERKGQMSTTTATTVPAVKYYGGGSVERRVEITHKVKSGEYVLPLPYESSGTRHYFGLGAPLYQLIRGSHMLCIDELENSLHPDLMQYFLQLFLVNAWRSQLLITTHSLSLMANEDLVRKDALWFTEKKEDGSVNLFSASDFDSNTLRKGASIIRAYESKKLGAKPNLGSPYLIGK